MSVSSWGFHLLFVFSRVEKRMGTSLYILGARRDILLFLRLSTVHLNLKVPVSS